MIALFLTALACPQAPPLVPATPADWRGERIEFPLDFAPDIALEGVEELRFARGMFEPGSETHWTYLFGLDVRAPEGQELDVDPAFVEDFLARYYRGLCGAVAGSQGLAVDLEAIAVDVAGGGASFQATIRLFDSFADGAPLELDLDLLVHPKSKGVELLGLAAPVGAGDAVRGELAALGEAWRAARPVPIFLNHVYVVPDLATYEALAASELLRELGPVEERTTKRGDLEYTGLYLYGEHTYLEFLKPDPAAGLAEGATGLAFGVELPGGLARIAPVLEQAGVRTFPGKITRELEGAQVPWFDVLGFEAATATQRLQLFAMEYDPEYLRHWHPPEVPESPRIDRAAIIARVVDQIGQEGVQPFGDISGVNLQLNGLELDRYRTVAREIGLDSEVAAKPFLSSPVYSDRGVQFDMLAESSEDPALGAKESEGLLFIHFALQRPIRCEHPVSHESGFGQVRIEASEQIARFFFFDYAERK